MGEFTKIAWADSTWNPWIGCSHAGPSCDHCYAETQNRFRRWKGGTWGNDAHVTQELERPDHLGCQGASRPSRQDGRRWLVFSSASDAKRVAGHSRRFDGEIFRAISRCNDGLHEVGCLGGCIRKNGQTKGGYRNALGGRRVFKRIAVVGHHHNWPIPRSFQSSDPFGGQRPQVADSLRARHLAVQTSPVCVPAVD